MKAFLIGFAVCAGPALAWHMRTVARRYDAPHTSSGPAEPNAAAAGVLGPDGPTRCLRFVPVTVATASHRTARHRVLCLKQVPCTGPHVDDNGELV